MQESKLDFGVATGSFACFRHEKQENVFILRVGEEIRYYCPRCIFELLEGAELIVEFREPQS